MSYFFQSNGPPAAQASAPGGEKDLERFEITELTPYCSDDKKKFHIRPQIQSEKGRRVAVSVYSLHLCVCMCVCVGTQDAPYSRGKLLTSYETP